MERRSRGSLLFRLQRVWKAPTWVAARQFRRIKRKPETEFARLGLAILPIKQGGFAVAAPWDSNQQPHVSVFIEPSIKGLQIARAQLHLAIALRPEIANAAQPASVVFRSPASALEVVRRGNHRKIVGHRGGERRCDGASQQNSANFPGRCNLSRQFPNHVQAQVDGKAVRSPPHVVVGGIVSLLCIRRHKFLIDDAPMQRKLAPPVGTGGSQYSTRRLRNPAAIHWFRWNLKTLLCPVEAC